MMKDWQGWLYVAAVLIPLAAFVVELLFIRALKQFNAYLATGAIASSFVLSVIGLGSFLPSLLAERETHEASSGEIEGEATITPSGKVKRDVPSEEKTAQRAPKYVLTGGFDWVVVDDIRTPPSDAITGAEARCCPGW